MNHSPQAILPMGILQARITGVGCQVLLQGLFPTRRPNSGPQHCWWIHYHLSHRGSPMIKQWKWNWSLSVVFLCHPMDCSLPGSSVHEIFQARNWSGWVAISFSRGPSRPKDRTRVSSTAGRLSTVWATREAQIKQWKWSEVPQSCRTLCNPVDYSLSSSSVQGILQARILEWVIISSSKIKQCLRLTGKH